METLNSVIHIRYYVQGIRQGESTKTGENQGFEKVDTSKRIKI